MNVQWFDGIAVMRLDPGEEVVAILREFATQENIRGAMFQGIGAFARVDLRYFDIAEDRYKSRPLDEQVEVVSLLGSIGRDQDTLVDPYARGGRGLCHTDTQRSPEHGHRQSDPRNFPDSPQQHARSQEGPSHGTGAARSQGHPGPVMMPARARAKEDDVGNGNRF